MHPVENKILNDLLDKYENSKLSRGENQRAIHIAFPFNKKTMPKYFDESSLEMETIHAPVEQMEREGLVAIAWKNQKPGYIIEKLVLCEDHVEEAYERLGRKPKREAEAWNASAWNWASRTPPDAAAPFLSKVQNSSSPATSPSWQLVRKPKLIVLTPKDSNLPAD